MIIAKLFFRATVPIILLFSAGAYAIPILQVNLTGAAAEDIHFVKSSNRSTSHSETGNLPFPVNPFFWNGDADKNNLLGNTSGFNSLYGLYSAFEIPSLGSDLVPFAVLDISIVNVRAENDDIEPGEDENTVTGFLATLGIATDWQLTEEHSTAISQYAEPTSVPFTPLITRRGLRGECPQRHYEQSQKPGLREDICLEGVGLAGGSGNGSVGSRGGFGTNGNFGSGISGGAGPGVGGGNSGASNGAGGAGGAGGTGGGTSGGNGIGSGSGIGGGAGNDNDNVSGENGGSGSSGVDHSDIGIGRDGEVRTIPEPTILVLLGFGFACMCTVRRRKK
jgi:hypothetical protein